MRVRAPVNRDTHTRIRPNKARADINAKNSTGRTALMYACDGLRPEITMDLLWGKVGNASARLFSSEEARSQFITRECEKNYQAPMPSTDYCRRARRRVYLSRVNPAQEKPNRRSTCSAIWPMLVHLTTPLAFTFQVFHFFSDPIS